MAKRRKRQDDMLIKAIGPAKTPNTMKAGEFFAFGSDPRTGAVGRVLAGRLSGPDAAAQEALGIKGRGALAGDRLSGLAPMAEQAARGDLRTGIPTGRKVAPPRGPQPEAKVTPPSPAVTPETKAPRPNIADFPNLARIRRMQQEDPLRFNRLRADPDRAGTPKERKMYRDAMEEVTKFRAAERAATESDVGFARDIAEERIEQEAMAERQKGVEELRQAGRLKLAEFKESEAGQRLSERLASELDQIQLRSDLQGLDREDRQRQAFDILRQQAEDRLEQAEVEADFREAAATISFLRDLEKQRIGQATTVRTKEIERDPETGEPIAEVTTTARTDAPGGLAEKYGDNVALTGGGLIDTADQDNRERYNRSVRGLQRDDVDEATKAELRSFIRDFEKSISLGLQTTRR